MREQADSAGGVEGPVRGAEGAGPGMSTSLTDEARRDAWAGAAGAYAQAAEPWTNQTAAKMLALADLRPRSELLDIGCGTGSLGVAAQTLGALVTGIDIAPSMIAGAEARPGGRAAEFRIGDMRALDAREGAFDAALANFSVVECGEPERALREAYRALRPGGRLAWTCWPAPTGGRLFEIVDAARIAAEGAGARPPSKRGLEPKRAAAMTEAAGFAPVETVVLSLSGATEASAVLSAAEKLDATALQTSERAKTLAALREALGGETVFETEAILVVARKPGAPDQRSQDNGDAGGAGSGGLLGWLGRWFRRG